MSPQARTLCALVPAVLWSGLCFAMPPARKVGYHLESAKALSRFTSGQLALLAKLNHADRAHLMGMRRVIVPDRWDLDELLFSPLPQVVPELSGEKKAIVVDLAAQVFGAFESGRLARWGPVSTGDRRHQTPAGNYHLNWQARVHVSSDNPTWILPWYFNFESVHGMALHEYSLPGRPASHGCIRMLAVDAKWLFHWGEGWTLGDDREVLQEGTPVLVIGSYDFRAAQPWLRPEWWARCITLPVEQIATAR